MREATLEAESVRLLVCGSAGDGKSTLIARLQNEADVVPADQLTAMHADCAVILIDARKGVLTQTRRHGYLVALLRIPQIVLAVNKMDLVDYSEARFREVERDFAEFTARIGVDAVPCIPISGLRSENLLRHSERTPWYDGPTLLDTLESVETGQRAITGPFRMPVQSVNRSSSEFRGFAGTVVSGIVSPGDEVVVAPSMRTTRIARIVTNDGDLEVASAGLAVAVMLTDEVDAGRGDMIAGRRQPPRVADQLEATIVWMHEEPMLRGRSYLMRIGSRTLKATMSPLKYKLNVDSLEHVAATKLELNDIGVCDLELSEPVAFDHYEEIRDTGSFILIDRITNDTVGAGLIEFALRRSQNIRWQHLTVDRSARAEIMRQTPCVIWLTGLSAAGKSTIANHVEAALHSRGHHTYLLDGDNVRHGLNRDLGFTDADRVENIRRVAEVAKLMVDAGLIVLVSFISPFRTERETARGLFDPGRFFEVYVDTPLQVAEARDPKGLYKKARRGELQNFTGIDSPYEPPEDPELRLETVLGSASDAAGSVIEFLEQRGLVPRA